MGNKIATETSHTVNHLVRTMSYDTEQIKQAYSKLQKALSDYARIRE